jgi:hypothetical protein
LLIFVAALAAAALFDQAWLAGQVLSAATLGLLAATVRECGSAQAEIAAALEAIQERVAATSPREEAAVEPVRRLASPHA